MASSLAQRILAILITIAICSPLTSGFTLHRTETAAPTTQADPTQHIDLTSEESVQLQVKDITRRPNAINNGKDSKAAENKQKQEQVTLNVMTQTAEVSIADIRLPISVEKTEAKGENKSSVSETFQFVSNNSEPKTNNENYTDIISKHLIKEINDVISILPEVLVDTTVTSINTDQIAIDTETTVSLTTDKQSSDSPSDITTQAITMTENEPEEITTIPKEAVSELQNVGEIIFRKLSENDTPKDKVPQSNNDIDILTGVTFNDEEQITTTEPSWKKYVTIDRKRTSSEDLATESTVDNYMFAKPTDKIPPLSVPPPERIDLQSEYNHQITSTTSEQDITTIENKITENDQIVSALKTDDKRLLNYSIDTKRAGFLDYSKTSPYESMKSTTEVNESNEPQSTRRQEINMLHRDMSDDEIKEELLEEEIINNEKQIQENIRTNSNNHQAEITVQTSKETSSKENGDVSTPTDMTSTPFTADALSVRPLHHDRRTTLYTISPNYKPMKKIDVQPPKPFVRDPDDNSWRNESISSLGIVFKPKNASKSFKEVLKNKTETEFSMLLDNKDGKNEVPDLRLRLEKIAEVRKSKKKKTNIAGEVVYIDYEENSSAEGTTSKIESNLDIYSTTTALPETTTLNTYHKTFSEIDYIFKKFTTEADVTTEKPNEFFNEYNDKTDEYEDYVTLPNIELKKFTRLSMTDPPTTSTVRIHHTPAFAPSNSFTPPSSAQRFSSFPERKPTIDYFPPRTTTPKVNIDHYDDNFEKKVNYYTPIETTPEFIYPTEPVATDKPSKPRATAKSTQFAAYPRTISPPKLSTPHGFVPNEGNFNRGSYVIKHYKNILGDAVQSNDDVEDFSYVDPTSPLRHTEEEKPSKSGKEKAANPDYMDYDIQFRREVLSRFLDNFNQNSEKYKIDFPILYNNSVVHQKYEEGRVSASSSTFVKGVYGNNIRSPSRSDKEYIGKNCEPQCDFALELSPAYELHYYVPDQEEKEQVDVPTSFL